jgi:spore germination protein YaaH
LLGLAFYGYDWNVTSGTARSLSYSDAAKLAERYRIPLGLEPITRSVNFRYQATAADELPAPVEGPPLQHEITTREAPPCRVTEPAATPTRTPRPTPLPTAVQEHQVWLEESASAAARLELANRYQAGGVAAWRLGFEDPRMWTVLRQWRSGGS